MLAIHCCAAAEAARASSCTCSQVSSITRLSSRRGPVAAGTTIAGYHELEKGGVRAGLINAVLAATQRADELSKL